MISWGASFIPMKQSMSMDFGVLVIVLDCREIRRFSDEKVLVNVSKRTLCFRISPLSWAGLQLVHPHCTDSLADLIQKLQSTDHSPRNLGPQRASEINIHHSGTEHTLNAQYMPQT